MEPGLGTGDVIIFNSAISSASRRPHGWRSALHLLRSKEDLVLTRRSYNVAGRWFSIFRLYFLFWESLVGGRSGIFSFYIYI